MNKEFIPYKLRTALVELGYNYDAVCYHRADMKGQPIISEETAVRIHGSTDCLNHPAILYQQAFRWFREKYQLYQAVYADKRADDLTLLYKVHVYKLDEELSEYAYRWAKTYEEAEQACLNKLIEIVKNGKTN